jgi:hypothetical protein
MTEILNKTIVLVLNRNWQAIGGNQFIEPRE